jgi:hypothetical protein
MGARTSSIRQSFVAVWFVSCLVLTGYSSRAALKEDARAAAAIAKWEPHLLYLLPSPHSRLHVEVDAVAGNEPDDIALEKLRSFLSTHCKKPDGIEIVRSDVITAEAARGVAPETLGRKYVNGPSTTNASPPAFIYALYYNYPLSRDSGTERTLHRGASVVRVRRAQNANPYADLGLYSAIYFNTSYSLGLAMNEILLHETGHLLGLVSRSAHARNGHCLNRSCQMNTHRDYIRRFRWLPGRGQAPLCAECAAELTQSATQAPLPNLRYVGPVLVRSEGDYHVLSLPERAGVIAGNLTDRDCQEFAAAMRRETVKHDGGMRVHCLVKDDVLDNPAKLDEILARLKNDPFVPRSGPRVLLRACVIRYQARGQHTNAADRLRQAKALDSRGSGKP